MHVYLSKVKTFNFNKITTIYIWKLLFSQIIFFYYIFNALLIILKAQFIADHQMSSRKFTYRNPFFWL